jgi:hypothetical protein
VAGRLNRHVVGVRGLLHRGERPEDDAPSGGVDLHVEHSHR